jgi:hypothetical protein
VAVSCEQVGRFLAFLEMTLPRGFVCAYVPVFRGVLLSPSSEKSKKLELEASGSTDTSSIYKFTRFYVQEHLSLHLSHYVCMCVCVCVRARASNS